MVDLAGADFSDAGGGADEGSERGWFAFAGDQPTALCCVGAGPVAARVEDHAVRATEIAEDVATIDGAPQRKARGGFYTKAEADEIMALPEPPFLRGRRLRRK